MFEDAEIPGRKADLLAELAAQDLDRLSIADLDARIAALSAELDRSRAKRAGAEAFRRAADALFRKQP